MKKIMVMTIGFVVLLGGCLFSGNIGEAAETTEQKRDQIRKQLRSEIKNESECTNSETLRLRHMHRYAKRVNQGRRGNN